MRERPADRFGASSTPGPPMTAVLIALAVVAFPVIWLSVVAVVARIGGWRALAERYEDTGSAEPEQRFRFGSVVLRRWLPARYRGSVHIGLGAAGLFLTPLFVFRFQHPPLRIPWTAVARCEDGSLLGFRWVDVELKDESPTLRFYGKVGDEVTEAWRRSGAASDWRR